MNASPGLLEFLGQKMGLNGLKFDENLQATITLDDSITVTFLADEEDSLTVVSFIADYAASQEQVGRQLLQLNFVPPALGGGKLAINPRDGGVILTRTWNSSAVDREVLYTELEMFVNAIEPLRQEMLAQNEQKPSATQENVPSGSLMMYGRMA